jgi:hypothetical protein
MIVYQMRHRDADDALGGDVAPFVGALVASIFAEVMSLIAVLRPTCIVAPTCMLTCIGTTIRVAVIAKSGSGWIVPDFVASLGQTMSVVLWIMALIAKDDISPNQVAPMEAAGTVSVTGTAVDTVVGNPQSADTNHAPASKAKVEMEVRVNVEEDMHNGVSTTRGKLDVRVE